MWSYQHPRHAVSSARGASAAPPARAPSDASHLTNFDFAGEPRIATFIMDIDDGYEVRNLLQLWFV